MVMQALFILLLSIFIAMETYSQSITTDRQPVAAGRFYPADKETLKKDISRLFEICKKTPADHYVRAIISPHAGYIYQRTPCIKISLLLDRAILCISMGLQFTIPAIL
jgi:hypothetical protein